MSEQTEPTELAPIIAIKVAVGNGHIDCEGRPTIDVLTIEGLGQQLEADDETWYHSTLILGSDQARELIAVLTPRAFAMPTPYEQLDAKVTAPTTDQKEDA